MRSERHISSPINSPEEVVAIVDKNLTQKGEEDQPQSATPENKPDKKLSPELELAKAEVDNWMRVHHNDIKVFLQYKGSDFNLRYNVGQGYYHQPKTDIISLDILDYYNYRKAGATIDQAIAFFILHELSHLKTMLEGDTAGKKNMLEHFVYESRKVIEDAKRPGKFLQLNSAYRNFYNILEDAIVNDLVLHTSLFGSNFGPESRRRSEELRNFYVDKAFVLYKKGEGQENDHALVMTDSGEKMQKVEPGEGTHKIMSREDYDLGFDMNQSPNTQSVTSQFLYFFMKNQMLGLEPERTAEDYEGDDKINVLPETSAVLNLPLVDLFPYLLKSINQKYANDPEKLKRYLRFMSISNKVRHFVKVGHRVQEAEGDVFYNVFHPYCLTASGVNFGLAGKDYKDALEKSGFSGYEDFTFIDFLNIFKQVKRSKDNSWTLPLKYNLVDRTNLFRKFLEPIFTMLSILDDQFDTTINDGRNEKPKTPNPDKSESSDSPDNEDENNDEWSLGDKVINDDKNSPNYGRKGVIRDVVYDPNTKKIKSVKVDYFVDEGQSHAVSQASSGESLSGDFEYIEDPDNNLILMSPDDAEDGSGGASTKRKVEKPKNKEKQDKKNKSKDKSGDSPDEGDDDNDSDGASGQGSSKKDKKNKPPKPSSGGGDKKENDQNEPVSAKDLRNIIEEQRKQLEAEIEADEEEDMRAEKAEQENSSAGKEKRRNEARSEEILDGIKRAEYQQNGVRQLSAEDVNEYKQLIGEYLELEKGIAPYVEELARHWLEMINNIASKIEAVKDRYYRSGSSIDFKKLQRFFDKIEAGWEYDSALVYERIIEKVMVELRPKMFRMILLIDNSGSMNKNIVAIRSAVMMMNATMRSLRVMFKSKMDDLLGADSSVRNDLVCDSEIYLFGSDYQQIKDFNIQDLSFVDNPDQEMPPIDVDQEIIATLMAFREINASDGSTHDLSLWQEVRRKHQDEKLRSMIAKKQITEMIFQISDGAISNTDEAREIIQELRALGVENYALAIGSGAKESLEERHNAQVGDRDWSADSGSRVAEANNPEQLTKEFSKIIKMAIEKQVGQVIEDVLEQVAGTVNG